MALLALVEKEAEDEDLNAVLWALFGKFSSRLPVTRKNLLPDDSGLLWKKASLRGRGREMRGSREAKSNHFCFLSRPECAKSRERYHIYIPPQSKFGTFTMFVIFEIDFKCSKYEWSIRCMF